VSYRYDGKKVQVVWEAAWTVGEKRRVRVLYTIKEPVAGKEGRREGEEGGENGCTF